MVGPNFSAQGRPTEVVGLKLLKEKQPNSGLVSKWSCGFILLPGIFTVLGLKPVILLRGKKKKIELLES